MKTDKKKAKGKKSWLGRILEILDLLWSLIVLPR